MPEQISCESGELVINGFGTVIVKVCAGPVQPFAVGVTVILATSALLEVFVATNDGKFPVPVAARPIAGFEFVQV